MADPIRLYAEFKDDLGDDWRLNIHDANYSSSAIEFKLGADGFVFRYSGDNEEPASVNYRKRGYFYFD